MKRSLLSERLYVVEQQNRDVASVEKEINNNKKEIENKLPKLLKTVAKPKNFVDILEKLEESDTDKFQVSFGQPVIEDFINILLFNMYRNRLVDKKNLDKLRKAYSKVDIVIHF